jgi:hypothetical protein
MPLYSKGMSRKGGILSIGGCTSNSKVDKEVEETIYDKEIIFQKQAQVKSFDISQSVSWELTNIYTALASIKTRTTPQPFNNLNSSTVISHIFTVQYANALYTLLNDLTQDCWILYNNKRYYISTIENVDEADKLIRFVGNFRGKNDIELTKSR